MAEKVLYNIAGGILSSLAGPLVAEEIRLLLGVEGELERLRDTVSTIRAVLLDAEERQSQSHEVSLWIERLSDVLYDADDLLDDVSSEALYREMMTQGKKAKKVRIFFSESNQFAFRREMSHKIKTHREKLTHIAADRRDFHFASHLVERPVRVTGRDNTYSFVPVQHVIGRENDKEAIIRRLLATKIKKDDVSNPSTVNNEEDDEGKYLEIENSVSILPIVGIGGLGKTTLAQLVFNDKRIRDSFDFKLKLWVCVSDDFDVKTILEKILESASKKKPEKVEMDTLVCRLREEVVKKRFFLVLDDVWNEDYEKWFELKMLLSNGVEGSKILITTRSKKVAKITQTMEPYILKGLEEKAAWKLFKNMAFENGQEPENTTIVKIGREVVSRCMGVPLAVGTMGRMLYLKDSDKEWLEFRDKELSKISQESGILNTLKLSYDKLSPHLKHCFAYCSLFPKDFEFEESFLIKLWMAQGFIESQEYLCLEDIGYGYLMELVSRLLLQDIGMVDKFHGPTKKIYKIHDIMHDLAISVAGSLIITTLETKKGGDILKARHMLVCDEKKISPLYRASKIRTLICFKGEMDIEKVISSFMLLRILVLKSNNIKYMPSYIGKLKHLRYLDLSENPKIKLLPDSITRLVNLQTLLLSGCIGLKKLPRGITKLVNLKHLDTFGCNLQFMPCGIKQLTNLQTLTLFAVNSHSPSKHKAGLEELVGLNNLRGQLNLCDWSNRIMGTAKEGSAVASGRSIFNILRLGRMFEYDESFDDEISSQGFQTCPNLTDLCIRNHRSPMSPILSNLLSFTSLFDLSISGIKNCKYLPPLCQLPLLERLDLLSQDHLEYILGFDDKNQFSSSMVPETCFPSLKDLSINRCPKLKGWLWRDSPAEVDNDCDNSVTEHRLPPLFSCLSLLKISKCPMLASMPLFGNITCCLRLEDTSWKLLQQITMFNPLVASSFTPLSKLESLKLIGIGDSETLSTEWMQYLLSLKCLEIVDFDKLKSLPLGLQHLTALETLDLSECPELEFVNDVDDVKWQGLKSLRHISFRRLPKLVRLPSGIQHVDTLRKLRIEDCEGLTSIPVWICEHPSLAELSIIRCFSLPVKTLELLHSTGCPITVKSSEERESQDYSSDLETP